ncbi:MAG TPA: peptide deformylase [Kofleriaceae bacterium]|nr:peptide deformylase [Kofleriaceae bacterium]
MAQVLKIVQAGDPVLRRRARPLEPDEISTPRIQGLIELMRDTMRDAPGVGLAAPQIGESIQLVVIEDPPQLQQPLSEEQRAERGREVVPFHVLINPELTVVDPEPLEFFEGCLSVEERVMIVPRAASVRVQALDARGKSVVVVAGGWYARILQHEIDHLHGTLCIDRMDPRTFMSVDQHQRFWRGKSVDDVRAELEAKPGS